MKNFFGIALASGLLAACATPALQYDAARAPASLDAARHRTVGLASFQGPYSGWFRDEFRTMLETASFQGEPWFKVGLTPIQSDLEGVYEADVIVYGPTIEETYQTYSNCIQQDEESKACTVLKIVEEICYRLEAEVVAEPRLFNANTQQLVFANSYSGYAYDGDCVQSGKIIEVYTDPKTGKTNKSIVATRSLNYYQPSRSDIDYQIQYVLTDILRDIRTDIAPYEERTRASLAIGTFIPELREDPRFDAALDAAKEQNTPLACSLFSDLSTEYPNSPALIFNLGVCAEVTGDLSAAAQQYSKALNVFETIEANSNDKFFKAFKRVLAQEQEAAKIDDLLSQSNDPFRY